MRRLGLPSSLRHSPLYVCPRSSKSSGRARSSVKMPCKCNSLSNRRRTPDEVKFNNKAKSKAGNFIQPRCVFPSDVGRDMRMSISPHVSAPLTSCGKRSAFTIRDDDRRITCDSCPSTGSQALDRYLRLEKTFFLRLITHCDKILQFTYRFNHVEYFFNLTTRDASVDICIALVSE